MIGDGDCGDIGGMKIHDYDENLAAHQSEISCEIEKKNPMECFQMLKMYGDNVMSREFLNGTNGPWKGRRKWETTKVWDALQHQKPKKNAEKISEIVQKDQCLSIRMIAKIVNMDEETVRQILHDQLNMRKVCAKMIPKYLTYKQNDNRKNTCSDFME
jgi:hypothetical protein